MALVHNPTIPDTSLDGQQVADNINANFLGVDAEIQSLKTTIPFDNSSTSLLSTTVEDALVELANVGLAQITLQTPYSVGQTLNTSPAKLSAFDTISKNINGAVTPAVDSSEATPAHKFTIVKSGLFRVYGTIEAEFASSDAVTLRLYLNGSPTGRPVTIQGRGAGKPVLFSYIDLATFSAANELEIYALSDSASTSFLVKSSSVIVERMPLTS